MSDSDQFPDASHLENIAIRMESLSPNELIERNKITLDKRLSLHDWSGRETLPDEVFDLTHLEELTLYGFNLKAIPKRIYNLTNLKDLRIRNASIKKFPIELMKLSNLVSLSFNSYNVPEIPKSINKWSNLLYLDIGGCIFFK